MTPLAAVHHRLSWQQMRSTTIMAAVRNVVARLGDAVGFRPEDVIACSMRSGGTMALLLSKFDTNTIWLVGQWHSNIMLRYLHTTVKPFMRGLASHLVAPSFRRPTRWATSGMLGLPSLYLMTERPYGDAS